MNASALKKAATGDANITQVKPRKTIAGLLTDSKIKNQIALALPRHMTADRLARIALTEVRKNPKLATCDQTSFLGAIMQCASMGLEPGGALGHCYLLPFDRRGKRGNEWVVVATEVQLIVGYRGMLDLARRSGQILSLEARVVYAKDEFKVSLGLDSSIVHEPDWDSTDRGPVKFVYAVAKLKDGGMQFEVMSVAEINRIRDESQGYKAAVANAKRYKKDEIDSPWAKHYDEMAKKTVIRRLFKYLPVSIEIQRAVGLDEQADAGIQQDSPLVIDGDYTVGDASDAGNDAEGASDGEHGEYQSGPLTAQEIHDALQAAEDRDQLNQAADLIRMLPDGEREPLTKLYEDRCVDLAMPNDD